MSSELSELSELSDLSDLSELELLPEDVLGYQITFLPFNEVKQLCLTSKRLNNFCKGTSIKQSNTWRNIIYNTFSNVVNYEDILLKLSKQYNCKEPCYNYYVYINFINYLDNITQLMIYYKQGDLNSLIYIYKYDNIERFIALFMLNDKEGMKRYERYMPNKGRKLFYALIDKQLPIQKDLDTTLIWASDKGYLGLVKYLVGQGADVGAHDNDAFRTASMNGHLEVVKYLVEHGADVHTYNDQALRYASMNGYLKVVKYLVTQEADVSALKDWALRYASRDGRLEVIKYLVKQGANVHTNNDEALGWAAQYPEIVKYLESLP